MKKGSDLFYHISGTRFSIHYLVIVMVTAFCHLLIIEGETDILEVILLNRGEKIVFKHYLIQGTGHL